MSGPPKQFEHDTSAQIIENLRDGLYFVDPHRVITYWNKRAERITGYSATEVVGRRCSGNILTHVDNEGICQWHGRCPLFTTRADGQEREVEVYLSAP